mgnify:CR=1 FL=1
MRLTKEIIGSLVVAPLRIARGIQNKVLEAMAMAKPVVASPAAAEGTIAEHGQHLFVERDVRAEAERGKEAIELGEIDRIEIRVGDKRGAGRNGQDRSSSFHFMSWRLKLPSPQNRPSLYVLSSKPR